MEAFMSLFVTDQKKKEEEAEKEREKKLMNVKLQHRALENELERTKDKRDGYRKTAIECRANKNNEDAVYYMQLYQMHDEKVKKLTAMRLNAESILLNLSTSKVTVINTNIIRDANAYMRSVQQDITLDTIDDSIIAIQDSEAITHDAETSMVNPFSSMASAVYSDEQDVLKQLDDMLISEAGGSGAGDGDQHVRSLPSIPSSHAMETPSHPIPIPSSSSQRRTGKSGNNLSEIVGLF
jgi:hypothetical protein